MAEATIDELVIEVSSDADAASKGLDKLVSSLASVEKRVESSFPKIGRLADNIRKLSNSTSGLNVQKLSQLGDLRVSKALGTNIESLAGAISQLPSDAEAKLSGLSALGSLGETSVSKSLGTNLALLGQAIIQLPTDTGSRLLGLAYLRSLGDLKISSTIAKNLRAIAEAVDEISPETASKLSAVAQSVSGFKELDGVKIGTFVSGLKKLPDAMKAFEGMDVEAFADGMGKLNAQLGPLAQNVKTLQQNVNELPKSWRSAGAAARTVASTNKYLGQSMDDAGKKVDTLSDRLKKLFNFAQIVAGVKLVVGKLGEAVNAVSDYVEDMNLYAASMGEFAESGTDFAMKVQTMMGIDSGEWMRFQGVLQSIGTGFGIANDRMAVMSQNMTQLGYDLASFYNLDIDEAMRKVQSGFAGELEPMRRIGYDLSVARMQIEATNLGIEKQVADMTQAEKAALRYHLMMTQLTQTHGDMARTINSPANQLRVLRAQLTLAARAIGNIFIPMLNAILPYAIAAAKAIRMLAETIAKFFGIDVNFEVDYSSLDPSGISTGGIDTDGLDDLASSAGDAGDAVEDTKQKVEELKRSVMGFDELNKLVDNSQSDSSGGSGKVKTPEIDTGDLGSVLDQIPMETYDFMKGLDDYLTDVTDKLAEKIKKLLPIIEAIAGALAAWKIADALLPDTIKGIDRFKKLLGVAMAVAGAIIYINGLWDAWVNGINLDNLLQMLIGMAGVIGGLALAFGPVAAGIGAIVTGLGLFAVGLKDAITNGVNGFNQIAMAVGTVATAVGTHLAGLPPIVTGIVLAVGGATQAVIAFLDAWNNGLGVANIGGYLAGITSAAVGMGIAINPIAGIITGIVGLFGLGVLSLREMITEGQNWANSIGAAISGIAEGGLGALLGEFAKFGAGEGSILWEVFANIEKLGGPFPKIVESVMEFAGAFAPVLKVLGKVAGAIGAIISVIDLVISIKEVFDAVTSGGKIANETIFSLVTSILGIGIALAGVVGWPALVVAAIVAAVAAIGALIYNNWDAICEFFAGVPEWFDTNVVQPVVGFFSGLGDFFSGLWETIVAGISEWWSGVASWFDTNVVQPVVGFFTGLGEFFGGLWEAIVNGISEWWGGVAQWFQDNVIQPIVDFWTPIVEWWQQLNESFGATAEAIWHNIGVFIGGIVQIVQRVWEVVGEWFDQNVWQPIQNFATNTWNNITGFAQQAWDTITGLWNQAMQWVDTNIVQPIVTGVQNAWNTITTKAQEAWNSLTGFAQQAWNTITGIWSALTGWFDQNIVQPIVSGFANAWNDAVQKARDAWNGITNAFSQFGEFFGGIVSGAWERIKAAFQYGGQIFEGVVDAIINAFKWAVNELIGGLNWAISQPFEGLNSIIRAMRDWEILDIRPFAGFWEVPVPQIPYLAKGGQVTSGQLFVARENGIPEMVGQMGGKTTVANNQQIVEGISQGVANAMFRVIATQRASEGGETVIEIPLFIGREELSRAVYKGDLGNVRRGVINPVFV